MGEEMILEPACSIRQCKHYIGIEQDNEDEATERHVCTAFPKGIPDTIAFGSDKHLKKVACGKDKKGDVMPDTMMVRSRVYHHLNALQARFNLDIAIVESDDTDYRYRFVIDKAQWTSMAFDLANEVDYGNFKGEVHEFQGRTRTEYQMALHDVWEVMWQLQMKHVY